MPQQLFRDRRDAGRALATLLWEHRNGQRTDGKPDGTTGRGASDSSAANAGAGTAGTSAGNTGGSRAGSTAGSSAGNTAGNTDGDTVVLALPRGGVPVAYEVAMALDAPLDVFVVRKLGARGRPELATGAVASGGVVVLNDDVVRALGVSSEAIQRAVERETRELEQRERAYREDRAAVDPAGRTVILVDDGLATGASMRAAIVALRKQGPARIVVAVPAAPKSTCEELAVEVDEVVCATTPAPFFAVGQSYWDFAQTTDEEVRELLRRAARRRGGGAVVPGPGLSEAEAVRAAAVPVSGGVPADDVLFDLVGDAQLVLIGEASHGTHEFYAARAAMTRRLIEERGFCAVAVEADWPDAYRVNRYVRGQDTGDTTAEEALRGFQRFPTWMWRNAVVLDFVAWLREHNDRAGEDGAKAGFYGLDLYSLHRSAQEVIGYLERTDPPAAARARERYSCFDHPDGGEDGHSYGYAAAFGAGESCERAAVEQLAELQRNAMEYLRHGGLAAGEELFHAERNAQAVRAAERYYRTMFGGRVSSWNLRDRHMVDTLESLADHLSGRRGERARIVVWAHNSHLGDAKATELGTRGEVNVGQLVRALHPDDCRLIGFTTYTGTVTAAQDWGAPTGRRTVRPALAGSVEELFHEVGGKEFLVGSGGGHRAGDVLRSARLQRAIGVIYRPGSERRSHYFRARVADQFDAVIHIDETRAVEPIDRTAHWERGEPPETYPHAV